MPRLLFLVPGVLAVVGLLVAAPPCGAAGEPSRPEQGPERAPSRDRVYGKTPEELVPYGDFGEPHRRNLFPEPLPYRGPGAEKEEPEGLTSVDLGLLAPGEGSPEWREGLSMTRGAVLAVERANAAGGYEGVPFRLIEYEDLPLWGASSNTIVEMAYEHHVWAALGSVSGDSSHIAIRVALKALLPVMNSATGDPTLTETAIPWAFRCIADSRQESYALARTIFVEHGLRRVAVIRANSRYGRMGIVELRDAAKRLGHPLVTEVNWIPGAEDLSPLVERVMATRPDGLVIWGGAEMAGRALAQARAAGLRVPAFGPSRVIDERFLAEAGGAAEGFTAVSTFDPDSSDPAWLSFRDAYRERWDEDPDAYAAHAFDGTNLVLDAVREAGLNRVRIRDALAAVERYHGVTGPIVFDNTFNDVGPVYLARVVDGAFRTLPRPANDWRPGESIAPDRAISEARSGADPETEPGSEPTLGLLRSSAEERDGVDLASAGRSAERGAVLALEDRSGEGATGGLKVVEVTGPWSTTSQAARDLMVDQGVDGLLIVLDHAGTHAAAQVATKLRRPLVTVNDPSTLLHYTGVPWVAGPPAEPLPPEVERSFERRFVARHGVPPDTAARTAYRAARQLLLALDLGAERTLAPPPSLLPSSPSPASSKTR